MRGRLLLLLLLPACADAPADGGGDAGPRRVVPVDAAILLPPTPDSALPGERPDATPGCNAEEACDGVDDDCDGRVDEGCSCVDPTQTACYGGPPDTRGVGICADGTRACDSTGETWGPCDGWIGPTEDTCGDGLDQDCDGEADEGCQVCEGFEVCETGADEDCDGQVDEGCDCADLEELCQDGIDNDCDGTIDEAPCAPPGRPEPCNPNLRRACFGANPAHIGVGLCVAGEQICDAGGRWGECEGAVLPQAEICDNGLDDDCDGHADDCVVEVNVDLRGDCITTQCPPEAPFPVGCDIVMQGNDPRGCVASRPDQPTVYFQEGDACGAGRVTGTLYCSNVQGEGLNEQNCRINKDRRFYPRDRSGCPDTN